MFVAIIAIILILISQNAFSQTPISHQNWQNTTVASDTITVDCAPLLLPFELGRLLNEGPPAPLGARGEMDKSLRSSHPIKVSLQPETGTSDQITAISGCTTNGAIIQLATADTGDTITVVHTPGVIEFAGSGNVILDSPLNILTLQRKAGIWVAEGGFGGGSGGGGSGTLDEAFDLGKVIDGASSEANAFVVGDGTSGWKFYVDTNGPVQECFEGANSCDLALNVASGNSFILNLLGTPELTIGSDGTTTLGSNLKEVHTYMVPASMLHVDGSLCTQTIDAQLNSRYYPGYVECLDNDGSTVTLSLPMPESWDASYVSLTGIWFRTGASASGNIQMDWATSCGGNSDPQGSFGSEAAMTFAVNGAGIAQNDHIYAPTASALSLSGCAKSDMIYLQGQINAAGTTEGTPTGAKLVYLKVEFKVDSWSD